MGSHAEAHADRAVPLGEWIARAGYHLLTGAGGGVMETVSRAFAGVSDRAGSVIGVVPTAAESEGRVPLSGYPNQWVEIPIVTHLDTGGPLGDEATSRNHLNILTSDVVVLLPGGKGTASEARLAIRYRTPCVGFLLNRSEILSLPPDIQVESALERVEDFVRGSITAPRHAATCDKA
jgi:uncharacterized protein (TIGR00725 family)